MNRTGFTEAPWEYPLIINSNSSERVHVILVTIPLDI